MMDICVGCVIKPVGQIGSPGRLEMHLECVDEDDVSWTFLPFYYERQPEGRPRDVNSPFLSDRVTPVFPMRKVCSETTVRLRKSDFIPDDWRRTWPSVRLVPNERKPDDSDA